MGSGMSRPESAMAAATFWFHRNSLTGSVIAPSRLLLLDMMPSIRACTGVPNSGDSALLSLRPWRI